MEILHICSDYAKQSIYNQLITHLSNFDECKQFVFVPCRSKVEIGKNINNNLQNVEFSYQYILNKCDRIFYGNKIRKVSKSVMDFKNDIDLVHAHFLFSDGGVALEYFKKYNIPYIVAVRNTDLNIFFKRLIHLRSKGLEILKSASKIIFLSNAYKNQLIENYVPENLKEVIELKSEVIPNGVDPFWLENITFRDKKITRHINIIYVGDFSKNKNIHKTIEALTLLKKVGLSIQFTIVGGGGNYHDCILKLASKNTSWIRLLSRVNDKSELRKILADCQIFCMPSKFETFGLVYVEAMSQGLPIIFTRNQGIDGYFEDGTVGYAVESGNIRDIANAIVEISKNYLTLSNNCSNNSKLFSWEIISKKYFEIYKSIKR